MRRLAAILLAGIISLSAAFPAFAAVETNADVWAVSSMEYAYAHGLITEEELQKATSPMSRQEFCGVIMHFLQAVTGIERKATQASPFSDCDDPMVIAAYETGIIGGVEPGRFAPQRTLTREQMAIMIARTLKVCSLDLNEGAKKHPFTDTKTLYASSNDYIDQLYGVGIVSGYDNGTFGPFREMTVQEAVISFVRAYRYIMTGDAEGMHPLPGEELAKPVEPAEPVEEITPAVIDTAKMDTVYLMEKEISLNMTAAELIAAWGEPDRIDESVYGLDRYIYLNAYKNYFFATMEKGKVIEIFVPGTDFDYLGMNSEGNMADIKGLSFVSAVEHSGVVQGDMTEARLPLDYEGNIRGLLLQTKEFAQKKNPESTLQYTTKEAVEAQLLDLIQVSRVAEGLEPLIWDKKLWDVARTHSEDMASERYFDYNSLDGTTPFGRIMERGKVFFTASETIARQRGDVVNIYQEWMRNASKLNALTDSTMQEAGVGVASQSKVLYVTVDLCGQMPITTNE